MPLTLADFPAFFLAVHGKTPFPWQTRLVRQVLASGWPETIDLPTASGKTAVLDVAVFTLALQAGLPPGSRRAPRRIALVVDRRIVVDDAHARAQRIRDALANATGGVLLDVREALMSLGGEAPLDVAALRGGIYREDRWARTPLQPVILCSTVDQVGSRLLHRGYGLTPGMWPIHAGLLGHDTLVILDEAHCSRPFLQTLGAVARLRACAERPLPGPFAAVAMTATPHAGSVPFRLLPEDDETGEQSQAVLRRRLAARKLARLIVPEKDKDAGLVEALQQEVRSLLAEDPEIRALLVVVNRVAIARQLRERVGKAAGSRKEHLDVDCILLTGRTRPIDRDDLLAAWKTRLAAGRERAASRGERPLVIVATQCIEVGADIDVDALVTEACPLDSLRQRLGRLDRLGERVTSRVRIVARKEQVEAGSADDPVYGQAIGETWRWLVARVDEAAAVEQPPAPDQAPVTPIASEATAGGGAIAGGEVPAGGPGCVVASVSGTPCVDPNSDIGSTPAIASEEPGRPAAPEIDLGIDALGEILPDDVSSLVAPAADAPLLFPAYCDLWVQTGPAPAASPEPSLFLHGPRSGAPEVQVVWRADLDPEKPDTWADTVALAPPVAGEALPLPVWLARRWLSGSRLTDEAGDVAGVEAPADDAQPVGRLALCWRGPEDSETVLADGVRPGDTMVVPRSYGGCDREGWNPGAGDVEDLADRAMVAARRRPVLRFHPGLTGSRGDAGDIAARLATLDGDALPEALDEDVALALDALAGASDLPPPVRALAEALRVDQRRRVEPHPSGIGIVVSGRGRLGASVEEDADSDSTSSASSGPLSLAAHNSDVARWAGRFGRQSDLGEELASDLVLAARLHDAGKADPRFQSWLAGGDPLRAARAGLLAKSERVPRSGRHLRAARVRSGYPEGARHELLSVRLLESAPYLLARARDPELVLHLVASHHGRCRPFAPVVEDGRPLSVSLPVDGVTLHALTDTRLERLDSGVPERFWTLVRRYGWWGLSFLEACLRLADHRASESPGSGGGR